MPSKQTPNYKLSQWARTDKVLMDDFNADNAAIDAGIKAVDVRVDGLAQSKADVSALNDLKQTVNTLSGTVSGHTSALSGHDSALAKLGACQVHITSYTGNGAASRTLTFPGYPVLVYIRYASYGDGITFARGLNSSTAARYSAAWSSSGLTLTAEGTYLYNTNANTLEYYVFALLDMSK